MNSVKTGILLVVLTGIIVWLGEHFGGMQGMILAFGFAIVMNAVSYWFSDKIVLAMYHAQPISENEAPELYSIIHRLVTTAGLPMPKVYLIPETSANAFATGRDPEHAAIAVTQGLLRILDHEEVEGVLAHELAHVKNRDILISTVAATLAGAIMVLAHVARVAAIFGIGGRSRGRDNGLSLLVGAVVAPLAALMVQMAISRSREYEADETGAQISGQPLGLAHALLKLDSSSRFMPSEATPASAHLFIVNPMHGGIASLFSTHPPISERVKRLNVLAKNAGQL
jgi:heat shock protein HtpX